MMPPPPENSIIVCFFINLAPYFNNFLTLQYYHNKRILAMKNFCPNIHPKRKGRQKSDRLLSFTVEIYFFSFSGFAEAAAGSASISS